MPTAVDPKQLRPFLDDDVVEVLRAYFESGLFTGGRFERFAGGGDRPTVADRFTADDVVAVSLLGVQIPGRAVLDLLEVGPERFNALLAGVPSGQDLWEVDESIVAPGSPAGQLWNLLVGLPGVQWVTAGKMMARKRPRLIPVYDRVVRQALGRADGDGWWQPLRTVLHDNADLVDRLAEVRADSGVGADISLLRILNVAIWMREHGPQPEPVPDAGR